MPGPGRPAALKPPKGYKCKIYFTSEVVVPPEAFDPTVEFSTQLQGLDLTVTAEPIFIREASAAGGGTDELLLCDPLRGCRNLIRHLPNSLSAVLLLSLADALLVISGRPLVVDNSGPAEAALAQFVLYWTSEPIRSQPPRSGRLICQTRSPSSSIFQQWPAISLQQGSAALQTSA